MRKHVSLWLSPLAALAVLALIYGLNGLFPFGGNTVSWGDMNQQVVPLLLELKNILHGDGSLLFTMETAGGMNFYGVFLFFLSSPFSFLVYFVPTACMKWFMNLLLAMKLCCCAFTAAWFFHARFPRLSEWSGALLSLCYALSGYTLLFYQNIVWLDVMALFPLLLLGLDRVLNQHKPLLYVLSLSGIMACQFYLGYMVAVFLLLAACVWVFWALPRPERGRASAYFIFSSFAAALLTGGVWLPALLQFMQSARGESLAESLTSGSLFTHLATSLSFFFSGGLIVVSLFFLHGVKKNRRLQAVLAVFLLCCVPLLVEPINKMWHTGSYQAFPIRYGFIPIFLGLCLCAYSLEHVEPKALPARTNPKVLGAVWLAMVAAVAVELALLLFFSEDLTSYRRTLWVGVPSMLLQLLVFLLVGFGLFLLLFTFRYGYFTRRVFAVLVCALTVTQLLFSAQVYIGASAGSVEDWQDFTALESALDEDTDNVFRVKMDNKYTDVNLLGGIGYNNLAHYTSLTAQNTLYAMKWLGYSGYWMELGGNGGTLVTDAILGNRYTVSKFDYLNIAGAPVYQDETYRVYENPLTLSLGLVVPESALQEQLPSLDRRQLQEYLYDTLLSDGSGDLITTYTPDSLEHLTVTEEAGRYQMICLARYSAQFTYSISVSDKQTLYFDCFDEATNNLTEDINGSFDIKVNGKTVTSGYPSQSVNGLVELGTFENTTITVAVELNQDCSCTSFGVFGVDIEKLSEAVQSANQAQVSYTGRTITATATAEDGESALYLSVPYDSGFSCTVNGKKAEISRVNTAFIAVSLDEGENTVVLTYTPPGLAPGLVLSGLGVLALGALLWIRRRERPPFVRLYRVCTVGVAVLGILCAGVVYVMPVVVWATEQLFGN